MGKKGQSPGLVRLRDRRLYRSRLLQLSPGGKRISVSMGLCDLPLPCLSNSAVLLVWCVLGALCRLPPPGNPNVRDCPGALDAFCRYFV